MIHVVSNSFTSCLVSNKWLGLFTYVLLISLSDFLNILQAFIMQPIFPGESGVDQLVEIIKVCFY